MADIERATRLWAADKLGIPVDTIESVDFEDGVGYGGYCDTCAYEYVTKYADVRLTSPRERARIDLDDVSFTTILKEIQEFIS